MPQRSLRVVRKMKRRCCKTLQLSRKTLRGVRKTLQSSRKSLQGCRKSLQGRRKTSLIVEKQCQLFYKRDKIA